MAVDTSQLMTQVVTNLTTQNGISSISGDEGSVSLNDPVDQLVKLEGKIKKTEVCLANIYHKEYIVCVVTTGVSMLNRK